MGNKNNNYAEMIDTNEGNVEIIDEDEENFEIIEEDEEKCFVNPTGLNIIEPIKPFNIMKISRDIKNNMNQKNLKSFVNPSEYNSNFFKPLKPLVIMENLRSINNNMDEINHKREIIIKKSTKYIIYLCIFIIVCLSIWIFYLKTK